MKKIITLILMPLVINSLVMCSKEKDDKNINKVVSPDYSEIKNGEYSKELIITNESSGNSVFLRIHADNKELCEGFLSNHEIYLTNEVLDIEEVISKTNETDIKNDTLNLDIKTKNNISIEVVASNMKNFEKNFSIGVKSIENQSKEFKNKSFLSSYNMIDWVTEGPFIGIINHKENYHIEVLQRTKRSFWHSWDNGRIDRLSNTGGGIYPYFTWLCKPFNYQRIGMRVHVDFRAQGFHNYKVVFSVNEFRGQTCTKTIPSSYDGRNCYVGTPPPNTTAFIFPNDRGFFYYTPINGNQCPMPGSTFDGANCGVYKIPDNTRGFIFENNWYVLPELLLTNSTCY
jgi:hypothetical protein